jgi:hypothetical protein
MDIQEHSPSLRMNIWMKFIAQVAALLVVFSALAFSQSQPGGGVTQESAKSAATRKVEAEVLAAIRGRLDARARRDTKTWASYVDEDVLAPLEGDVKSKANIIKQIEGWPNEVKYYYGPLEDVKFRLHGDTAIVAYRAKQYNDIGGQITYQQTWQIETHMRRGNKWLLVSVADAPILVDPIVAKVDPAVFDAYVGEYAWAPTLTSKIVREGDRLFEQFGQDKDELLPESATTFFMKGGGSTKWVFVKDEHGRVTHYLYQALGSTDRTVKKIR